MPEDTVQPTDTADPTPGYHAASALEVLTPPTPDAVQEQPAPRQMQPGDSMIAIGPEGMQLTMLPPSLPLTFRADKDLMRRMVIDWLHEDEQYWDVIVKARIEELRTRKQHLTLVTDPATVKAIGKSRTRGKA